MKPALLALAACLLLAGCGPANVNTIRACKAFRGISVSSADPARSLANLRDGSEDVQIAARNSPDVDVVKASRHLREAAQSATVADIAALLTAAGEMDDACAVHDH